MAGAIFLAISGCNKFDQMSESLDEIRFSAEYPALTRATGSAFEKGDEIGVYITKYNGNTPSLLQVSSNYASNIRTAFDGTAWKSSPAIYWEDGKFDVYAYYPYDKPASTDAYVFSVAPDQSLPETTDALSGYEASDFLWAKAESVSRVAVVPLTFRHRMSRFVIRLQKGDDYEGDIPTDAIVRIHNTVTKAEIDLASGIVSKNAYEGAQSITARKESTGTYAAIIVPQRVDTRRPLVEVLVNGVSYLIESSFVFKAGTQHTMTVTLNNNPDQVKIEIGGEITGGWN